MNWYIRYREKTFFEVTHDAIFQRFLLLADRLTRDPKIINHDNSCIILQFWKKSCYTLIWGNERDIPSSL